MRVRSDRRTRLLLLLVFVAAGLIALYRFGQRGHEAQDRPAPAGDVIEVEIED